MDECQGIALRPQWTSAFDGETQRADRCNVLRIKRFGRNQAGETMRNGMFLTRGLDP